jgi:hypothetical protein
MKKRLLLEIITSDSKSPVSDFIGQLDTKFKNKIVTQFTLLQDCKYHLQPPLVKAIRHSKYKGLYELRTRLNQTMSRIIFCFDNNDNIILLHGFLKKHNRSIEQALEIARARQLALDSKKVYTSIISSRRQA